MCHFNYTQSQKNCYPLQVICYYIQIESGKQDISHIHHCFSQRRGKYFDLFTPKRLVCCRVVIQAKHQALFMLMSV